MTDNTDNSLTEHVARAICIADGLDPDEVCEQTGITYWTLFEERAQAAEAAVMERLAEPTEAQLDAARMSIMESRGQPKDVISDAVWRAMLAAADKKA